ncbi:putative aldehyde dehydrogenase [Microstroma glucosiphilum]|uniref:Putative aldehyde dehydrogenase n=1 Tax=Pseudomicrostroma glucosiphilum TaxID=1684307 RepID=A0A316U9Y5_9BASI|nr:putative aldehyde dehydrogenase [Pseudomicrostroma glucosiphilum]PWN22067.1 putative aldehyde dehydrogenase [Pseudomicrostroma glucosiphilum]
MPSQAAPDINVRSTSGRSIACPSGIFINNAFVTAIEGKKLDTVNPATGQHLATVECGTSKDVDVAVNAAKQAFATTWGRKSTPAQRVSCLLKLADLIEEEADELGELESLDNGKPKWIAKTMDVADVAGCFRYYGGLADKIEGKTIELNESIKMAMTKVQPIGVCAAVCPFNYPLGMLSWKLAPALAAGNCVILKPAEQTPITALRIAQLAVKAGFPPGVLGVINGYGPDVGAALATHTGIDKIAFTGSTATGMKIAEMAARSNLKKTTLELGGKSPVLVFDDADLEKSLPWVVLGIMFNQGQDCTAGSRLFVQSGIYDTFVKRVVEAVQQHAIGDPLDDNTFQGPQVSQAQQTKILDLIESGKSEGAKLECGGQIWPGAKGTKLEKGFWVAPTVFSGCSKGMRIFDEEIFGPVLSVAKFETEEEAIALANDTDYGLGAGIFSQDISRCMRVTGAIDAGTVWVNNYVVLSNSVPFGGFKRSGMGRELGVDAIKEYTQVKSVHINWGEEMEWPLRG